MMNKSIFIFIIFFVSLNFNIHAEENAISFIKLMQLHLDKNQPEKVEEIYDDHEAILSKQWIALERLAISFERRGKLKEAADVYRKLIVNFNQTNHDKVLRTPMNEMREEFYNSNKLPLYYYKLAFIYTQLFVLSHKYTPEADRKTFKQKALGYITLSQKVKVDDGELKLLADQLNDKIKSEEKLRYVQSYYATFDVVSWQDRVYLISNGTKARHPLLGTSMGTGLGGGVKWQNVKYEFNIEGTFLAGSSTVSSSDPAISYQQSSVAEKGLMIGPGFYLRTLSENVQLGIQIPFMYRKGDWTLPDSTYSFEKASVFGAGYLLQAKFKVMKVFVRTRIGKVFPSPGSQWSIGALYDF